MFDFLPLVVDRSSPLELCRLLHKGRQQTIFLSVTKASFSISLIRSHSNRSQRRQLAFSPLRTKSNNSPNRET